MEGLAWLHYFYPEEFLSDFIIDIIVVFRDLEWKFFRVLKIVLFTHHRVAVTDYDSCHAPHFSPNDDLKVRKYCLQVAPLTRGIVKDPNCINLLDERSVHHLKLYFRGHSRVWLIFGVIEALGVENPEFSFFESNLIEHVILRARITSITHFCQLFSCQVID
jgi:hypothetical protein